MSAASRARLGGLVLALAACQATEPREGVLVGSFGSPIQNRGGYLAFSLRSRDGVVTGRGWSTASPTLLGGGLIEGSYDPPDVHLTYRPLLGITDWHFNGVFQGDTLKGTWGFGGLVIEEVQLARVDTIPLGQYALGLSGAIVDNAAGSAQFGYAGNQFLLVQTFQIESAALSGMQIFWRRRDLPATGTYPLSGEGGPGPSVVFTYTEPGGAAVRYQVVQGSVTISLARRYVLAGKFNFTATSPLGDSLRVNGLFSSGCFSASC